MPTTCCASPIACADPVIFLEPKLRYWSKEPIPADPGPALDRAVVPARRPGRHADRYGAIVGTAMQAAEAAAADEGWDVEVVDLAGRPVAVRRRDGGGLVRRTGPAVVVHEAAGFGGTGPRSPRA